VIGARNGKNKLLLNYEHLSIILWNMDLSFGEPIARRNTQTKALLSGSLILKTVYLTRNTRKVLLICTC